MSRENVELVQRFADGARERPDAVWDIFDEGVEWELDPAASRFAMFLPAPTVLTLSDTPFVAWSAPSSTGTTRSRSRLTRMMPSFFAFITGGAAREAAPHGKRRLG